MAHTIVNTFNVYENWAISSYTGNLWQGGEVVGRTSGAKGVLLVFYPNFGLVYTNLLVRKSDATAFTPGGEIFDVTGGGSLTMGSRVSTTTTNTITVTGDATATDSTCNTNDTITADVDDYIWTVTDSSVFSKGDIIKVDNELCIVYFIADATTIHVHRACYDTAVASHSNPSDIYIMDDKILQEIYDASVSGGWGYESIANGTLNIDAYIFIGDVGQSAITRAFSKEESMTTTNDLNVVGNSTYESMFGVGVGKYPHIASSGYGSLINAGGNGLQNFRYGLLECYASLVRKAQANAKSIHMRNTYGTGGWGGVEFINGTVDTSPIQFRDLCIGMSSVSGTHSGLEGSLLYQGYAQYGTIFVFNRCDADLYEIDASVNVNADFQAWLGLGHKYFIDGNADISKADGTWAQCWFAVLKRLYVTVSDEQDNPIENAVIRIRDVDGLPVLFEDVGLTLDEALTNTETVADVNDSSLVDVGQYVRINNETCLVTSKTTGTPDTITITRGQGQSLNVAQWPDRRILVEIDTELTDSDGKNPVNAFGMMYKTRYNTAAIQTYQPFKIDIIKDGYETITRYIETLASENMSGYIMSVKLKRSPSNKRF